MKEFTDRSELPIAGHYVSEMIEALRAMVKKLMKEILPSQYENRLKLLVLDYANIFQVRLGPERPASIAPMKIAIKKNADPERARVRIYPSPKREFLKK